MKIFVDLLFHILFAASFKGGHLFKFSKYFTDENAVKELGINILNLKEHQVNTVLNKNHGKNITNAAHDILVIWRNQYEDTEKACNDLLKSLEKNKKGKLCGKLKKILGHHDTAKKSGLFILIDLRFLQKIIFSFRK